MSIIWALVFVPKILASTPPFCLHRKKACVQIFIDTLCYHPIEIPDCECLYKLGLIFLCRYKYVSTLFLTCIEQNFIDTCDTKIREGFVANYQYKHFRCVYEIVKLEVRYKYISRWCRYHYFRYNYPNRETM